MAFISKAKLVSDFADAFPGITEARFDQLDFIPPDILLQTFAGILFKILTHIGG